MRAGGPGAGGPGAEEAGAEEAGGLGAEEGECNLKSITLLYLVFMI